MNATGIAFLLVVACSIMLVAFYAQLIWCLLLTCDAEEINTCIFQSKLFCCVLSTTTVMVDLWNNDLKNILVKKLRPHLRKPILIMNDCFSTANISSTCNNTATLNTITDVLCRESNVSVIGVSDCWNLRNTLVQILWNVEMWDSGPLPELDEVNACVFRDKSYIFNNVTKSQLQGKQFEVVTKQEVPYMLLEGGPNNTVRATGGCEYQLLEALAGYFGFTYILTKPVDDEFGDIGAHGKWTGMIGYLQDKKADIAICGLSITKERETVVDFSTFYANDPVRFITHTPGLRPRAFVIIRPFSKEVWLSVIGAHLITSLLLQTMSFLSNRYQCQREQTTFNAIWYLGGTLTQQGGHMSVPESLAVRVLVGVWWLAVIVILGCYSGTLTSFMMYPKYKKSLDDVFLLVDAVEKGYYTWGTVKGSSCMTEIEKSHNELLKKLADNVKQRLIVSNVREGVQEAKHQNYGFFYNELNMLFEMPTNHKKYFVMSADYITMDFVALAFQKNFVYQELFNSFIQRAVKAGLVQKWMDDINFYYFHKVNNNSTTPFSDNDRPLNLTDLQGAFYVLGFGLLLSTFCLFVEWLFWKTKIRRKIY